MGAIEAGVVCAKRRGTDGRDNGPTTLSTHGPTGNPTPPPSSLSPICHNTHGLWSALLQPARQCCSQCSAVSFDQQYTPVHFPFVSTKLLMLILHTSRELPPPLPHHHFTSTPKEQPTYPSYYYCCNEKLNHHKLLITKSPPPSFVAW